MELVNAHCGSIAYKFTSRSALCIFYRKVLNLFGIDAFELTFGSKDRTISHTTVVVPIGEDFFIFDPTFAAYYTAQGKMVSAIELLESFPSGGIPGLAFEELNIDDRVYVFDGPPPYFCTNNKGADGCYARGFSFFTHYLDSYREELRKRNLPVSTLTFPTLMHQKLYFVGDRKSASVERFLARLAKLGIDPPIDASLPGIEFPHF